MTERLLPDVTPSERSALVAVALRDGQSVTPDDVARLTECRRDSGYRVLRRLERVLPIFETGGAWHWRDMSLHIE
jgi:hypothetical protein